MQSQTHSCRDAFHAKSIYSFRDAPRTELGLLLPQRVPREVGFLSVIRSMTQSRILPSRCTSCEAEKQKLTKGFNTLAVTNYILLNPFIINKRRTNTSNPYTGYIFIESRWYRIASPIADCCTRVESLHRGELLYSCQIVALVSDRYARTKLLCFYLISVFCHILASPAKSKEIFTGQNSLFVSLLRRKSKNKLIRP